MADGMIMSHRPDVTGDLTGSSLKTIFDDTPIPPLREQSGSAAGG